MSERWVYFFGEGSADGDASMKGLLGGKGANLAEMTNLGLPVPPGFTLSTAACTARIQQGGHPVGLRAQVDAAMQRIETIMGRRFADAQQPLLVSVRSGAPVSMPGMMDTVLNLGLNDDTVKGLAAGGERFAWDSYRRFVQMYGNVVMGVPHHHFEGALSAMKAERGATEDTDLTADDLRALVRRFKATVAAQAGRDFPTDVREQLWGAIEAVFDSWNNERAIQYRRLEGIDESLGTAVTVQAMVFGNMGDDCATGVAFTRDPSTGERLFFGEFLANAQGEDVVAGIRTPRPIVGDEAGSLQQDFPAVFDQLQELRQRLELHYHDMQDIEFTVERDRLWMLQTRTGKRSAAAAVRIAVEMVDEELIDVKTAVLRVSPEQINTLLHRRVDPLAMRELEARGEILTTADGASPGAAIGQIVFTPEHAVAKAEAGIPVVLVRHETSPEDIAGMAAAEGILTVVGGKTSHAAVVARGMGKPCIVGASALRIRERTGTLLVGDHVLQAGEVITIDGSTGQVVRGEVPTVEPDLSGGYFERLMGWADGFRRLGVRTNADTPHDAQVARGFGAEGIGLCRTEHMFFGDRVTAVRRMILSSTAAEREAALAKLLPMQRSDFVGIFREMEGFPVTIRLLDPPLHEFLPHSAEELAPLAAALGVTQANVEERVRSLRESNPMLGHRGCRLAITYPEIAAMQVEAIIGAACEVIQADGVTLVPEIMVPLVSEAKELSLLREVIDEAAERAMSSYGVRLDYLIGTMIELPRAALLADEIALHAEFFSYGTNDLTQTTFGLSRDDASRFLPSYYEREILTWDPFASMDRAVGQLVQMGTERGRSARPELKVGICGEHGGDPKSIRFCNEIGLDYVSCSPYRVPVARMAAAHASLDASE